MLRRFADKGWVSYKILNHYEMANKVKQLIKSGMSKVKAVKKVALQSRTHERTVYRACKSMA